VSIVDSMLVLIDHGKLSKEWLESQDIV